MTTDSALKNLNLTQDEFSEIKRASHVALARRDLLAYSTYIEPQFETPDHLRLLAYYLMQVELGAITRLAITMPPRHGKSYFTSGIFPSWCLGRNPERKIILSSYSEKLALKFSAQNRDIISDNPYFHDVFPDVYLKTGSKAADRWAINNQSETFLASGVGGGITGFGGWMYLIDDPVKNYEEAISPAIQERNINWYTTVANTRLTPDGVVVLIMTRWHENDLWGAIEALEGDKWTTLHLPATSYGEPKDWTEQERKYIPVAALPDPLRRPKGSALWPEKFDEAALADKQATLQGEYQALYQGNPTAPDGSRFKRSAFQLISPAQLAGYNLVPLAEYRSWDLAWSASDEADYTAGLRLTLYGENIGSTDDTRPPTPVMIVLTDMIWHRLEWDDNREVIIETALSDGADVTLLVEAVASQNTGVKSMRRDNRLWKHVIKSTTPDRDKVVRASSAVRAVNLNWVYVVTRPSGDGRQWWNDFIDEAGKFPNGKNDDQVDAFTQAVIDMTPTIDAYFDNAKKFYTQQEPKRPDDYSHLPFELRPASPIGAQRDGFAWSQRR